MQSPVVPLAFSTLNQQGSGKNSHKWLNFLPRTLVEQELFWVKVYGEVIKLGAILEKPEKDQNSSP